MRKNSWRDLYGGFQLIFRKYICENNIEQNGERIVYSRIGRENSKLWNSLTNKRENKGKKNLEGRENFIFQNAFFILEKKTFLFIFLF